MSEPTRRSISLTDRVRPKVAGLLQPIGRSLIRLGFTANALTIMGTLAIAIASGLIATGSLLMAGVLLILSAPIDALDGTVARLSGVTNPFGAFLDSTSDRYAEGFIFVGLSIYGLGRHDDWIVVLSIAALWGSLLVSYTRARAEGLGRECKVGILTRLERFVVLCAMLIFNQVLIGLILLAVLTHITALQRIAYVWRVTHEA